MIYGLQAAGLAFELLDPDVEVVPRGAGGAWREQGGSVLSLRGSARALLTGERTALNFLAHLSGVATAAARAVARARGHLREGARHA